MTDLDIRLILQKLEDLEIHVKALYNPSMWLDIQQAIKYSACSKSTLQRGIQSGELKYVKRGGKIRLKMSWLDQWLILGHCKRLNKTERERAGL